jgi:hypothetical protein
MGQYFKVVNLDRCEWFDPGAFGETTKHPERDPRTMEAFARLLMPGGAWCGDSIAIVGDESAEPIGRLGRHDPIASTYLYSVIEDDELGIWKNIAEQIGGKREETP